MWTKFWDMYSGGSAKERQTLIFIEAPIEEAKVIFYNRFHHSPQRVTCTCCGEDYAIYEASSLEEATEYHRGDVWIKGQKCTLTVEQFAELDHVLIIRENEIRPTERVGVVPKQGYIWVDEG